MRGIIIIATLSFCYLFGFSQKDDDFLIQRLSMVRNQISGRGITNSHVLEAMRTVPRHMFVPPNYVDFAYDDRPLSIGYGQTISQPFIVAYMTDLAKPKKEMLALEIGTGSGYQASILAQIVDSVFTIEIVPELGRSAKKLITKLGYNNIQAKIADGYFGWESKGPFDIIIVTAAAETIPPPLIEQLKEGGRMIIPVGSQFMVQQLMMVEKKNGKVKTRSLIPVRFVPFTRSANP